MPASLEEINTQVGALATAWEEYKHTNDSRLKEIEKKGNPDVLFTEKLAKMDKYLDDQKAAVDELKKGQEELHTAINRAAQGGGDKEGKADEPNLVEYKKAFRTYLRKGAGQDYQLDALQVKAMSVQSDPDGGYLVTPEMSDRIVDRLFDTSPIRQIASVETITSDALEGLKDTDEASGGWVAEAGSRPETSTPQIGMWKIPVHEIYANPKATQKLIDDAGWNVESWLSKKVSDIFSRKENTAFVVGTGVGQPRGFTTYSTAATADSSRNWGVLEHVATGNAGDFASSNPADVLFDLISRFKPGYLSGANWVTRRTVIAKVRKFKDTTGQYLWQPALQAGQPDSLVGYAITMAEDMPALASGSLSLALGNFAEGYTIVDRAGIRTLRDPYTSKPFVQFYTTKRTGGDVLQFEAIKFIKFS